jgi:hypothetical protein
LLAQAAQAVLAVLSLRARKHSGNCKHANTLALASTQTLWQLQARKHSGTCEHANTLALASSANTLALASTQKAFSRSPGYARLTQKA